MSGENELGTEKINALDAFNPEIVDNIDLDGLNEEQMAEALKKAKATPSAGADDDKADAVDGEKDLTGGGKKPDAKGGETDELSTLKQQNEQLVEIVKRLANQGRAPQQQREPETKKDINFFDGKEEDDIPTVQEINKILSQFMGAIQYVMQQAVMPLTRTNYNETVTSFLPKAFEAEPELEDALSKGNVNLVKYHVARLVQKLSESGENKGGEKPKPKGAKPGEDAQTLVDRIQNNLKKPGAPSDAAPASPLGRMALIDDMDDADFGKLVEGVISGSKRITRRK